MSAHESNGHVGVVEQRWRTDGRGELTGRPPPEVSPLHGEFLAQLSHELRTPLNAIIGFSEILQTERAGPVTSTQKEFLDDVLASSRHLLRLIDEVLDLANLAAGRVDLGIETVDLPTLIAQVGEELGSLTAEKEIPVEVTVDPAAREVRTDRPRLRQVLEQLLSNALKFSPPGGRVRVEVRTVEPDAFELAVVDTGIGIPREELARLFVPFQQINPKLARKYGGRGLGLALTRRIVEALGGQIRVESEVGRGSRFTVVLPSRPAPLRPD